MELLGTVRGIYRYPVKSMAGESRPAAELGWHGLDGDRRFAFRRVGDASGFPWLSASRLPALLRYRPCLQPGLAGQGQLRVVTPEGEELAGDGAELRGLISAACGSPVELLHLRQGIYDEAPISLITLATVRRLSEASGVPLDLRRFRPNLFIETPEDRPFVEDGWVGRTLSCGGEPASPLIGVTLRDLRCAMLNLDPDTARADPRLFKAAAQLNTACAGVYGVPVRTGALRVGDGLYAIA